eukprot:CAMPEP_0184304914 /NCGR_PEP_ID=MMETSP1049-20130417/14319_1 /TAXON_ID=77928 /ORGANISM="Proteomonas sulcata, Strain CCMP704" /LENGTH=97 /DNA_ID=CAMNT_0026616855 /DNA_START=324 /DNA_END=617 /DNA_ORIENTATION=-
MTPRQSTSTSTIADEPEAADESGCFPVRCSSSAVCPAARGREADIDVILINLRGHGGTLDVPALEQEVFLCRQADERLHSCELGCGCKHSGEFIGGL